MTPTPTVSIIIATWNYSRFIGEALESLFAQTFQHFEVIVVDDGSTDDTAAVMRSYQARVTYVQQEHRGHTAARDEGVRLSRGKYLCFFDADDICEPEKLELQVAFMDEHPEVDLVFSDHSTFDERRVLTPSFMSERKRFQRVPFRREGIHRIFSESLFEPYLYENFIFPGSMLIRKDYFSRIGVFDGSLAAKVFHGRLIYTIGEANAAYTDKVLIRRRVHRERLSGRTEIVQAAIVELYQRFLKERGESLKARHRLLIRARIGKAYWRLGCAAVAGSNSDLGREYFRRSLATWPLQRLAYVGLVATHLKGSRRLLETLRKARWP